MMLKTIRPIRDRTPGIGDESNWLVTITPCQFWQMVARQLKLWEGLIKPAPWHMQT
jgi:hypothetical protein